MTQPHNHPLLSAHKAGMVELRTARILDACQQVRDIGVDLIEFDVRVTRDGKPIVAHDEFIYYAHSKKYIRELDMRTILSAHPHLCTLDDILHSIKGHAVAHVDLKDDWREIEIVQRCIDVRQ